MQITFSQLESQIAKKDFAPVYLFHGEEDFLIEEGVNSLLAAIVDPATRGFNCDILHGGDLSSDDVAAMANAFPMMADRRVVVVHEFEKLSLKETGKSAGSDVPFIRYIKQPNPTCAV